MPSLVKLDQAHAQDYSIIVTLLGTMMIGSIKEAETLINQ